MNQKMSDPTDPKSSPTDNVPHHSVGLFRRLWKLGFRELPLQNETTTFILLNVFDVFMTYTVLRYSGVEANPVAKFFLDRWGFSGMIFFKMAIVAFVCVVAQVIGHRRLRTARWLLNSGTFVVGVVVIYGIVLYLRHLRN